MEAVEQQTVDLETFLAQTWAGGLRWVAAIERATGAMKQFKVATPGDAAKLIRKLAKRTDVYQGVFFTPFCFQLTAKSRKEESILATKVLFVDVDSGANKPYKTKQEAAEGLANFVRTSGFPPPTYVTDSGNGFHPYWVMTREPPGIVGAKMQRLLKQTCLNRGLHIDASVSSNPTIVMRALETYNAKDPTNLKQVRIVGGSGIIYDPEALLNAFGEFGMRIVDAADDLSDNDELTAGIEHRKSYMRNIVKKCPLMGHIRETHGATCVEPLWMATLQLAKFVEDGTEWVHVLSDGHPGYSPQRTEEKFQLRGKGGPTLCERFKEYADQSNMAHCLSCEFYGKIKTPFVLGIDEQISNATEAQLETAREEFDALAVAAEAAEEGAAVAYPPAWPKEYSKQFGKLWRLKPEKKGSDKLTLQLVVSSCIETVELAALRKNGAVVGFDVAVYWRTNAADPRSLARAQFDLSAIASPATMLTQLARQGFTVVPSEQIELGRFLVSYIQKLQAMNQISQPALALGWGESQDNRHYFALPGRRLLSDGTEDTFVRLDPIIAGQYTPKGSLDEWKTVASFIAKQGHQPLVVLLASAFAAPLMSLMGVSGAVLAAVSFESGVGKSDALRVAQAVWGDPATAMASLNDTVNSMEQRMGTIRHLPIYWDEIRGTTFVDQFVNQTFRVTEGSTRGRLDVTSAQKEKMSWKTILVVASNDDLVEPFEKYAGQNNAGLARLIQYFVPPPPSLGLTMQQTLALMRKAHFNYGHAGVEYAKAIVKNRQQIIDAIDLVGADLERELAMQTTERFWYSTLAALVVGATIAKNLDLVPFDVPALRAFLVRTIKEMREHGSKAKRNMSSVDILHEFIRANYANTLVTDRLRYKGDRNPVNILQIPAQGRSAAMQLWKEDGQAKMRVPARLFTDWLRDTKHNARTVMAQFPPKVLLRESAVVAFCAGTAYEVPAMRCHEFAIPGEDLAIVDPDS